MAAMVDAGAASAAMQDPSMYTAKGETAAAHVPVQRLTIGTWTLNAKYDEHILLSFYWAEKKLVWEVRSRSPAV